MYPFKPEKHLRILPFFLFLILSACWWERERNPFDPKNPDGGEYNSLFRVENLEASGYINIDPKTRFPDTFTLRFKTCMKDTLKTDVDVEDAHFVIEYNESKVTSKKTVEATSNENGCIRWSEEYPYKYVLKPPWIGLNRIIKGREGSYFQGSVPVPTAVNPWILGVEGNDLPAIIDLRPLYDDNRHILKRYSYLKNGLEFLNSKKTEYPWLWASGINLQMDIGSKSRQNASNSLGSLIDGYRNLCDPGVQEAGKAEAEEDCYSRKLRMTLSVPLVLRSFGVKGQIRETSVSSGTYSVEAHLVAQYPKGRETYYRLHRQLLYKAQVDMGRRESADQSIKYLSAQFEVDILYKNINAAYKLIVEIKSQDPPFKKFQGTYTLKELQVGRLQEGIPIDPQVEDAYRDWLSQRDKSREIDILTSMNIQSLFGDKKETQAKATERLPIGFHPTHLGVKINENNIRFASIKTEEDCGKKENVIERTIEYTAVACFEDFLVGQPKTIPFRIIIENPKPKNGEARFKEIFKKEKGKQKPYETDLDGCIKWSDSLHHKNYNRQIYIPRHVHFISMGEEQLYGQARIGLNPWQGQFQFGKDLTRLGQDEIRTTRSHVPYPRLVINQFKAINFYPSYLIDKLLNIHLSHNLYFLFQAIISRHDNLARGRHPLGREFIRDGYYLVRVLLMRNPQESHHQPRVILKERHDRKMKELVVNRQQGPSFHGGEYLTHVDTVVQVRINWVNMYVPTSFNTEQFLYLGSRNQLSIEVYPADPGGFVYKRKKSRLGECELDLKKTEWRPYKDHDLQTEPYTGPFQPQEWTNWNVLQPAPHLNTDSIVNQSEKGRRYRRFTLHSDHSGGPSEQNGEMKNSSVKKPTVLQGRELQCSTVSAFPKDEGLSGRYTVAGLEEKTVDESTEEITKEFLRKEQECFAGAEALRSDESNQMNFHRREGVVPDERQIPPTRAVEVLKKFTEENSLRLIDLSRGDDGDKLVADLMETGRFLGEESKKLAEILHVSGDKPDSPKSALKSSAFTRNPHVDPPSEERPGLFEETGEEDGEEDVISSLLRHLYEVLDGDAIALLSERVRDKCFPKGQVEEDGWLLKTKKFFVSFLPQSFQDTLTATEYNQCSMGVIRSMLESAVKNFEENYQGENFEEMLTSALKKDGLKSIYAINYEKNIGFAEKMAYLIVRDTDLNQLKSIVNEGVTTNNYKDLKISSFIHNLCGFWFEKYFSEYLRPEQMVSAYTGFVRNFDYIDVLENQSQSDRLMVSNLMALLRKDRDLKVCHEGYTDCLLDDYCSEWKSEKVCANRPERAVCGNFLQDHCGKDPSHALCLSGARAKEEVCKQRIRLHCEKSPNERVCQNYSNRCLLNYKGCAGRLTDYFESLKETNPFRRYNLLQGEFPFKKCVVNPFEFFRFENKMIVEELDPDHVKYLSGLPFSFSVSGSHSIGSYMNWAAARSSSASSRTGVGPSADVGVRRGGGEVEDDELNFSPNAGAGSSGGRKRQRSSYLDTSMKVAWDVLKLNLSSSISSSVSNSSRRAVDVRIVDGVYMSVHRSRIELGAKKFKKCLVIRPRPSAFSSYVTEDGLREDYDEALIWSEKFHGNDLRQIAVSRPGLIICNPMEERERGNPERIVEHYYYITHEVNQRNVEFMNLYDIANRPFILILRGQNEFYKLFSLLRDIREGRDETGVIGSHNALPINLFEKYSYPIEEAARLTRTVRESSVTGFQKGIYTYPDRDYMDIEFVSKNTLISDKILEAVHDITFFPVPSPPRGELPVQSW